MLGDSGMFRLNSTRYCCSTNVFSLVWGACTKCFTLGQAILFVYLLSALISSVCVSCAKGSFLTREQAKIQLAPRETARPASSEETAVVVGTLPTGKQQDFSRVMTRPAGRVMGCSKCHGSGQVGSRGDEKLTGRVRS